jgi:DNA-binding NtrC family response regulator
VLIETPESSQTRRNLAVETLSAPKTVLVVDDEDSVRNMVQEYLSISGYKVLTAADGPEALRLSQEHQGTIHLLLTDVLMPGMNGGTLAARMASTRPETKVLYMSGYTPNAAVHYSVVDHGTAFLPKPFTSDTLLSTIRIVLEAH